MRDFQFLVGRLCMKYLISSTGLYSTWLFSQQFNTLFDCGEGMALSLQNKVFAIDRVCLSHGHMDHIGGLPSLLWARVGAMGDHRKPLTIYYPDTPEIRSMKQFIDSFTAKFEYELTWTPVTPESRIPAGDDGGRTQYLQPFPTRHGGFALGYQIFEERERLRPQYRQQPDIGKTLAKLSTAEKTPYLEQFSVSLMAFSGDTMTVDANLFEGCQTLFFDATFLRREDREDSYGNTHASLDEACELALAAGVKRLFAYHVSPRYSRTELEDAQRRVAMQYSNLHVTIVPPGAVMRID